VFQALVPLYDSVQRIKIAPDWKPPYQWVPGRETDHSPLSDAEIKNDGAIPPIPHMSSWRGA
jgi:hypothetical protein